MKSILRYKKDSKLIQKLDEMGHLSLTNIGDYDVKKEFSEWNEEKLFCGPAGYIYEDIFEKGIRPSFEIQDIRGKVDVGINDDPVFTIAEWFTTGKISFETAKSQIQNLIKEDIRNIDAYAHLGAWYFESNIKIFEKSALKNFKAGSAIGYLSIEKHEDAAFPWGWLGNRPFHRSLHGLGLTLWRMNRPDDADKVFTKMLWLNPTDNLGVRFCIEALDLGMEWKEFA